MLSFLTFFFTIISGKCVDLTVYPDTSYVVICCVLRQCIVYSSVKQLAADVREQDQHSSSLGLTQSIAHTGSFEDIDSLSIETCPWYATTALFGYVMGYSFTSSSVG